MTIEGARAAFEGMRVECESTRKNHEVARENREVTRIDPLAAPTRKRDNDFSAAVSRLSKKSTSFAHEGSQIGPPRDLYGVSGYEGAAPMPRTGPVHS